MRCSATARLMSRSRPTPTKIPPTQPSFWSLLAQQGDTGPQGRKARPARPVRPAPRVRKARKVRLAPPEQTARPARKVRAGPQGRGPAGAQGRSWPARTDGRNRGRLSRHAHFQESRGRCCRQQRHYRPALVPLGGRGHSCGRYHLRVRRPHLSHAHVRQHEPHYRRPVRRHGDVDLHRLPCIVQDNDRERPRSPLSYIRHGANSCCRHRNIKFGDGKH